MKVPPTGHFCLPFLALLRIRILCTFSQTSRNINQHQLRLLTPVRCHELCFSDEKQSLSDRYRGSNRGDWKFPVIRLWVTLPFHFFLSQMAGTPWQGQWNLAKHLSNMGCLHPTANPGAGNPPAHWTPTSPSSWAEQGCLPRSGHCWPDCFSNLSTPRCKPSQAVSILQCRHILRA